MLAVLTLCAVVLTLCAATLTYETVNGGGITILVR
jgi:hypothetical protein